MKTALQIIKDTWEEYMVYRLNFLLWRVRMVMQMLVTYFLWWAIFSQRTVFAGYTEAMMLTYILLSSIVRTIILSTTTMEIGDIINEGNLSNHLLRPFSFFSYYISRDAGDKLLNLLCSVIEVSILFVLLRPPVFIQTQPALVLYALIAAGIGMVLYFLYNMIFGFMGFWTQDVWAPRFLSFVILEFLAGSIFPLDILPKTLFLVAKALPFYYFLYFPLGVYLGKITGWELVYGFAGALLWVAVFWWGARLLWRRGLRVYTAEGR